MSPLSRRKALSLAGGLALSVATAGCQFGRSAGPPQAVDPQAVDVGTWVSTDDGRELRVRAARVRRSVVTTEEVSSTHVYEVVATPDEGQYLVATATARGFDVQPMELPLSVAVDGEPGRERSVVRVGREDVQDRDRLAFELPRVDAPEAAVVWQRKDAPDVRWRLGDDVRAALAAVPSFAVESVTVPDRVARGEDVPASFTVRNDGGRDGRFLTTFGVQLGSLPIQEVRTRVPAGETVTHEERLRPPTYDDVDSLRVVVDWGRGHREATVEVVDAPTSGTPTGSGGA